MQKISSYLYPNRIILLADLAGFNVEYTNVYQRNLKIYKGIDNVIEFDIKNADQKRIELVTSPVITDLQLNVMDAMGNGLPNSPYTVTPSTTLKGIAVVTIPSADLDGLAPQFLHYSVTATKDTTVIPLYADTRSGAVGTIELAGNAMPVVRPNRVYDDFTAEIDLNGHPTFHSSAIPVKFYEAVPTETVSFSVDVVGFVGSVWLEATKKSTINVEAFKQATYLRSSTAMLDSPVTGAIEFNDIPVGEYEYMRISYQTPTSNGIGAAFTVTKSNNVYTVVLRFGGTNYTVGSQMKVLGSVLGGTDGINDLILTVVQIDSSSTGYISSYSVSSVVAVTSEGTASDGHGTYIVTGTNITGNVDKITVS